MADGDSKYIYKESEQLTIKSSKRQAKQQQQIPRILGLPVSADVSDHLLAGSGGWSTRLYFFLVAPQILFRFYRDKYQPQQPYRMYTRAQFLYLQQYQMNLNNLTPWDISEGFENQPLEKKNESRSVKLPRRTSVSLPQSTLPNFHSTCIKTPTMIEMDSQIRDPLMTIHRKRLSLPEPHRRRRSEEHPDLLSLVQNQYPIQPVTMTDGSPVGEFRNKARVGRPQLEYIQTLIESERRCVKLQMMPELKIKLNRKRRSTPQLTLTNILFYYDHHRTKAKQSPPKVQNVIQELAKKIPAKKQPRSSKSKGIESSAQPYQTIRTMKFDSPSQQKRSPTKAYSRVRVDHFLDRLLERMH